MAIKRRISSLSPQAIAAATEAVLFEEPEEEVMTIDRAPQPPALEVAGIAPENRPAVYRGLAWQGVYNGNPKDIPVDDLLDMMRNGGSNPKCNVERAYRARIRSPLSAIRAWCVSECKCGQVREASSCAKTSCPLWPFHMGKNAFFGKLRGAEEGSSE